jgi:hypothetical protein
LNLLFAFFPFLPSYTNQNPTGCKPVLLVRIREYTPDDFDALRRLHAAQGFGYPFPDLESPLFVTKLILEDDGDRSDSPDESSDAQGREEAHRNSPPGSFASDATTPLPGSMPRSPDSRSPQPRIAMAVLLRLTAEAYLLHDPAAGTPRQRWQRLLALHAAARSSAAGRGLDDVQAFLPPRVARAFSRRLARLGWMHDPWPCFSRRVVQ